MLSVEEALKLVLDHAQLLPPQFIELEASPLGMLLAEPIVSDIDSPPHDKSVVDGYALIAGDVTSPSVELTVIEEVTAGDVPVKAVERGTATRIMTGAPIPAGADAVVMVEQTTLNGDLVRILQSPVKSGQNIGRRGASLRQGQTVLPAGKKLRAIECGLLAEVGRKHVHVRTPPQVAILCTGNELVGHEFTPGPGQIRNSNGILLQNLVMEAGGWVGHTWTVRDDKEEIDQAVRSCLMKDVVVITGGVSAGVLDLVPGVLRDLGVQEVFHRVNLKPGKPLWFGVRPLENRPPVLVFGLPGNPVSGLVCFELFVRPAIEKLSGREPKGLPRVNAVLSQQHKQRGDRPTYWPARVTQTDDKWQVTPLPWQGSGDLRTLTDANCLALFPGGDRVFQPGENVTVLQFD